MGMSQFDKERQRQRAINQSQAYINAGIAPPAKQVIPPIPKKPLVFDMEGREFAIGQKVVRPVKVGNSNGLKVSTITHIAGPQVYVDNSQRPIGHPERMLIILAPSAVEAAMSRHVHPSVNQSSSRPAWPFPTGGWAGF